MGRIPDRVIEEIRERADIVQVVGRYVNLKKSGSRHWGLCPFHSEKTPSFQVHPDRQIYHCFGCGEGGDVFSFRMRHDGADFLDTVRSLAQEFGVAIPDAGGERESRTAPLYALNDLAHGFFRNNLRSPEGARARTYLEERGVPQDLIDRFGLGFAPPRWDGLVNELQRTRESFESAEEAGLIARRQNGDGHYDRFRGRVVFPIMEPSGRVVGFGGRGFADETPKYLNSPESPIYHKGRALFGLSLAVDAIRQHGRVVVVEGYFDLIALHRAGITEGVAPCGTALSADHARRLRRYAKEVIMLFDGDEAGQRAAERSLPVLASAGLRVRAAFLSAGDDPDTLLAREGEGALRECVDAAVPLIDHLIDQRLGMRQLREWEAADLAQSFGPILASVPDEIERAGYERRIANRLGLPPAAVSRSLRGAGKSPAAGAEPALSVVELDPFMNTVVGALAAYPDLVNVVDGLDLQSLPEAGGPLAAQLIEALRKLGDDALPHLLSPVDSELPVEARSALAGAVAHGDPGDRATAERALRDCVARLRIRALDQESQSLTTRLENCTDPQELERLLERKQQTLSERSELWSQVHQL